MNVLAILTTLALLQGGTGSAYQFDLVCAGKIVSLRDKTSEAWSNTYRIDLNKRSWCAKDCTTVFPLEGVTEQEIDIGSGMSVDRTTGKLSAVTMIGTKAVRIEADCEPEPFSGFPGKLF